MSDDIPLGKPLPALDPGSDHRYQIGDAPVFLSITVEDGKPRLRFVMTAHKDGTPMSPPAVIHLATFRGGFEAEAVRRFLDEMLDQVNEAISYHEEKYAAFAKMHASIAFPQSETPNAEN